jgi:hypothetical protein
MRNVIARRSNFLHDPLACGIALGWNDGVVIDEIPLKLDIEQGWLHEKIDYAGKLTWVVTRIDGNKFNEYWLNTICNRYSDSSKAFEK